MELTIHCEVQKVLVAQYRIPRRRAGMSDKFTCLLLAQVLLDAGANVKTVED